MSDVNISKWLCRGRPLPHKVRRRKADRLLVTVSRFLFYFLVLPADSKGADQDVRQRSRFDVTGKLKSCICNINVFNIPTSLFSCGPV